MSKAEFLKQLEEGIANIPQLEKERIMNYYNETLEDAMEDGVSEEAAIASLGEMADIIKQIHLEHKVSSTIPSTSSYKTSYAPRYILLFISSPFWLTGVALLVTLYLLYLTALLVIGSAILADIVLIIASCFNVIQILIANFASGVVLIGCMLIALGILPWLYWLLMQGVKYAKLMYEKGTTKGLDYWRKAVA